MPQIDLQAPADGGGGDAVNAWGFQIEAPPSDDPEAPPESVLVPVDGLEWTDVAGAFVVYQRYDSTKGSTNPKAQAEQRQQHLAPPKHPSASQRFSGGLQAKPHIIGLPAKIEHHSGHLDRSGRRAASASMFATKPNGPGDGGQSGAREKEPGSPKVSCMGKVLSGGERDQCRRRRRRAHVESDEPPESSTPVGCWASVSLALCCAAEEVKTPGEETAAYAAEERRVDAEAAMEPPGMGAMRRQRVEDYEEETDENEGVVKEFTGVAGVSAAVKVQ